MLTFIRTFANVFKIIIHNKQAMISTVLSLSTICL